LHPVVPHWYLAFVGIDTKLQGRGIGRKLMAPVLNRADREGTLCYLETPFVETHDFYRALGFDLRPKAKPFKGAPGLWPMERRPMKARAEQPSCGAR